MNFRIGKSSGSQPTGDDSQQGVGSRSQRSTDGPSKSKLSSVLGGLLRIVDRGRRSPPNVNSGAPRLSDGESAPLLGPPKRPVPFAPRIPSAPSQTPYMPFVSFRKEGWKTSNDSEYQRAPKYAMFGHKPMSKAVAEVYRRMGVALNAGWNDVLATDGRVRTVPTVLPDPQKAQTLDDVRRMESRLKGQEALCSRNYQALVKMFVDTDRFEPSVRKSAETVLNRAEKLRADAFQAVRAALDQRKVDLGR
jgi:hypothetical protein